MGTAITKWHPKALGRAKHHVSAQMARRLNHRQREKVSRYNRQSIGGMNGVNLRLDIAHMTATARIADEGGKTSIR